MFLRSLVALAAAAASMFGAGPAHATGVGAPLQIDVYNPGEKSLFPVSSEIVTGKTGTILIDAQFQRNDAEALVNKIKATGKPLKLVYVSHSDPDYYFGLDTIKAAFPDAKIVATPQTVAAIKANKDDKLAYWGPILKDNAPRTLVVPQPLHGDRLTLDGHELRIVGLDGPSPDRTFVSIPSARAVVGGIPVAANIHVWIADTQTPESRRNWIKTLDRIAALHPSRVVPGHYLANPDGSEPYTLASVKFTRDYLVAFDAEAAKARNSGELITAMKARYPNLADASSLEMSAKVIKGEMQWPVVGTASAFPAAGKKALVQFGDIGFRLDFKDDHTMTFVGTAGQYQGATDTVEYKAMQIRPQVFMVYWHEPKSGDNVVHVEDFENGIVYTNIAHRNGEFQHLKGTIRIEDAK
ncbi:MBL fold metallo-hydrolase [Burkholderia pseudomallei]|uniref:MBL fold metallo-hydrolase n=1 Tax=Burkholderia pseudomallei TaxID=28450 RepID=UPI0005DF618E|nr:MBL fold metallo-hydrolase [Burkholderia pseudomallei]MBK3334990.1 MBL fold metallo-hydrolase [Burkholderia pseudomallei]NRE31520.1 MBL fold metallo-hydrolase [Burkholderia pseudomallei]CAK1276932.1 metallo-beta-lactamase family protein [Burkholderia pseudomallei]